MIIEEIRTKITEAEERLVQLHEFLKIDQNIKEMNEVEATSWRLSLG